MQLKGNNSILLFGSILESDIKNELEELSSILNKDDIVVLDGTISILNIKKVITWRIRKAIYLQPLYQQRATHCSFNCEKYKGQVDYSKGICPVVEKLHFEELFTHEYMRPGMSKEDMNDVIAAFHKVAEHVNELR